MPETDSKIRALYHYIADGTLCANEWYRDLDNPNKSTNVTEFVEVRTLVECHNEGLVDEVKCRNGIRTLK